ncbi:glycosyltransferase [Mucilaginibacter sp.]|uniref:glycosyltransferase family 2 protein n=1 Tax=Mucilaginibacter sp. TaxID=1882438 RepID=UPI002609BE67|nr:glycosyltransferase [Mucilaginibacter sp.]MDB4927021.1 family 2 glycosyl transferase [Mucilaginibacter sp.]
MILQNISLLVPCYNASKYIGDFLAHISNLGFAEVIFYDDGSTDNTLELLTKSGFKVIGSTANNGTGFARNRLAGAASCAYIHFHDIDDRFNPDFVRLISEQLPGSADVIVGDADWIVAANGETLIEWRYDDQEAGKDTLAYFITHPLGIINTVYKKDSFLASGGFNEHIRCWEDSDLHVNLAAQGYAFAFTAKVLAYSMRHQQGLSSDQDWCWECRLEFLEGYLQHLPTRYRELLLNEVARCAQAFYDNGQMAYFDKCIRLCGRYGLRLPVSKNWLIKFLKQLPIPGRVPYDIIRGYKKLMF